MLFVRHAQPVVARSTPPAEWVLAPGVELWLDAPRPVLCSAQAKARQTAELFADEYTVDARLGEVERGWSDDFERDVARYLAGASLDGWEPQADARARFTGAVDAHGDATYVTHGTVLTLYLASVVPRFDAFEFWRDLRMPDAWSYDAATRRLVRVATGDAPATT